MPKRRNEDSTLKLLKQKLKDSVQSRWDIWALILISLISLVLQLYLSLSTWGMAHPDEVFQSLEVAHDLVFGYGTLPPEFLPENIDYPSYAQCRSYIFPLLFALPMYFGKIIGWDYWLVTIPLIRIFLGINGALITPSTYFLVTKYSGKKKTYGLVAALFVTISPMILPYSFRSLTNFFFVPWIFFSIVLFWNFVDKIKGLDSSDNEMQNKSFLRKKIQYYLGIMFLSIFIGIILYIRVDLIIGIVAILLLKFPYKRFLVILSNLIGFAFALIIGGLVDLAFYDEFLISPINWIKFNIIEGNSTIFGEEPFYYYFTIMYKQPVLLISLIASLIVLMVLIVNSIYRYKKYQEKNFELVRILGGIIIAVFFVIVMFSIPKHKEARFIYFSVIYFHLSLAISIVVIFKFLINRTNKIIDVRMHNKNNKNPVKIKKITTYSYFLFFAFLILGSSITLNYIQLTRTDAFQKNDDIAKALAYVGNKNDSFGVMIFEYWFWGEMYTYLHKNITMWVFPISLLPYYMDEDVVQDLILLFGIYAKMYNYIVMPLHFIDEYPMFLTILEGSNFFVDYILDGRTTVYRFNP